LSSIDVLVCILRSQLLTKDDIWIFRLNTTVSFRSAFRLKTITWGTQFRLNTTSWRICFHAAHKFMESMFSGWTHVHGEHVPRPNITSCRACFQAEHNFVENMFSGRTQLHEAHVFRVSTTVCLYPTVTTRAAPTVTVAQTSP